jgi:hypothetical protein
MADKAQLLREASEAVNSLYGRFHIASGNAGVREGHNHHTIIYGMQHPLSFARDYITQGADITCDPEVGVDYPIYRPIKRARARRATEDAALVTSVLLPEKIQDVIDAAQDALSTDIEQGVTYFARILTRIRAGEDIHVDWDEPRMRPVKGVREVVDKCYELMKSTPVQEDPSGLQFIDLIPSSDLTREQRERVYPE